MFSRGKRQGILGAHRVLPARRVGKRGSSEQRGFERVQELDEGLIVLRLPKARAEPKLDGMARVSRRIASHQTAPDALPQNGRAGFRCIDGEYGEFSGAGARDHGGAAEARGEQFSKSEQSVFLHGRAEGGAQTAEILQEQASE